MAQCVMTSGMGWMLKSSANNSDTTTLVRMKDNIFHYSALCRMNNRHVQYRNYIPYNFTIITY